jgi:hypothetical protein
MTGAELHQPGQLKFNSPMRFLALAKTTVFYNDRAISATTQTKFMPCIMTYARESLPFISSEKLLGVEPAHLPLVLSAI